MIHGNKLPFINVTIKLNLKGKKFKFQLNDFESFNFFFGTNVISNVRSMFYIQIHINNNEFLVFKE